MLQYRNCPHCFMPLGNGTVCPSCRHDYSQDKVYSGVMSPFSVLNKRYLVGRVLGKGGFGITYIAKDMMANRICAVKEYMPSEYSTRSNGTMNVVPFSDDKARFVFTHGREKFVEEARTLAKLRNDPIVVDILDYFTENNTAYLVMEYLDGQDLRKLARASGGKLDPEFAKMIFLTTASSLMGIHKMNILHRDLSPENIIYTKDGRIKLIDFGAARNFVSTQNKGMSILLKPGFAPPEQYNAKGNQGPWSDVYALCATFYTLVSGKPLVDALFRYRGEEQPSLASMGCRVTKKTSDVIAKGMELEVKNRYKSFKELLDEIDVSLDSVDPSRSKQQQEQQRQQNHRRIEQTERQQNSQNRGYGAASSPPPPPAKPYVAAVVGNTLCNKVMLGTSDVFKIGRSAQSSQYVVAGDTNISRIHCYIRYDGRNIFLCDVSSNGTFLENGTQLIKNKEYPVKPGTKFYLATQNHMLIVAV